MIALNRAWIASSASPHVIRSKRPSPRAPTRRSGVRRRPAPWTNAGYACGTFAQSTPPVYGLACEPRILTIRSSSTVTVRLQVSGQSSGQTLGRSTLTAAIVLESGGTAEGGMRPCCSRGSAWSRRPRWCWYRRRRSEEHTSELQSHSDLVCRLLLEKKKKKNKNNSAATTRKTQCGNVRSTSSASQLSRCTDHD